jgi:hypothetical protein
VRRGEAATGRQLLSYLRATSVAFGPSRQRLIGPHWVISPKTSGAT